MKYALAPLFLASPALAHDGAHVHPHGGESWLLLLSLALGAAAVGFALARRK
ncbi:hypothetical protein AAFO92_09455 [Roseovarius sp. CAU 1744]|uniref:hypothetical protein n=1 Tax=Roseovarius sp. CAU 1744 TaxID=3140368 RepID=UPI00325A5BDE